MRTTILLAMLLASAPLQAQRTAFHVADYDLALQLPEIGKHIEGVARLTVVRLRAADTLVLDLEDLKVSRVSVGGTPAPFAQGPSDLRVIVAAGRRDTIVVEIAYAGVPKDGLIIGTDTAGRWVAFGDNWPNRGRHWIPSIDHPSEKSTVTWSITAPTGRTVVANGKLLEETMYPVARDPDGSAGRAMPLTLTRWRESRPIPVYLMVIAAAPLVRYNLGESACGLAELARCVEQSVYVAPEQRAVLPGEFARAGDIVSYYSATVGPFPYEKLSHLQSSTRYGGMENASAIFYADALFRRSGVGSSLIAHETAHQWFGDAVTERAWGHVWLSEGFATYFAALWARHAFGDSALRAEMSRTRSQILRDAAVASRPVIDSTQTDLMALLNTNSYQKGGWTLHMLRSLVGDSAFFQGIRDYWASHRHGTALTDDLMVAIEKRSGTRLGWFFDQWLRRPGWVQLTADWHYDPTRRALVLDLTQGDRFAPYRFPLTVAVTDAAGVSHRVTVDVPATRSTQLSLPLDLGASPRSVELDPDVTLLAEIKRP